MKHQEVRVNIWQMIVTSGSYLFLAMCAWVLLRLVNACFWLPGALKKQQSEEEARLLDELRKRQAEEEGWVADEQTDQLPEEQEEDATNGDRQEQEEIGEEDGGPQESKKTI